MNRANAIFRAALGAALLGAAALGAWGEGASPGAGTPIPTNSAAAPGAQAAMPLSVNEAVDLALRNNLGIAAERLKLDEKKWEKAASWNVFLPKANLTAAMYRSNLADDQRVQPDYSKLGGYFAALGSGGSADFPTYTVPRWGAQFILDIGFTLSAAQFIAVRQTALDYRMGIVTEEIAEKRLVRDVKKLYWSLLLLDESLDVLDQSRSLAQRRLDLARARERIGSATEVDVLAEEVGLEAITPQIIEQRDSYETALANFRLLLGLKRGTPLQLSDDLSVPRGSDSAAFLDGASAASTNASPALPLDEAGALGKLGDRLDLSYLRSATEALKNKLASDVSGMTPSLFVKWTADPTFQRDIADSSTWSGASVSDLWKQSTGALTFGVSVPLDPLLPGSRSRTDAARSRLQIQEAELGYRNAREAAEIEVLSDLRQIDKATKLIAASDKSVTLAERLYAAAEKSYASGAKDYLEVQDAHQKLIAARFESLRDRQGYLTSLSDLEYALTAGDLAKD